MWKTGAKIVKGKARPWKLIALGLFLFSSTATLEFVGHQTAYTPYIATTMGTAGLIALMTGIRQYEREIEFEREKARKEREHKIEVPQESSKQE